MNTDKPERPLLRYHGGKWKLAPWIISHFPKHRIYVEPFGGAASILLRKERSYAEIYNDLDNEIVQLFQIARDDGETLARKLEMTPFARAEFNEAYHPTTDPIEACRRTIIRSYMGFGSDGVHSTHRTGFRSNSNRSGTTPAHDWMHLPDAFRQIIIRLQGIVIECRPAIELLEKYDGPDVLFYLDPPYVHSSRKRVDAGRGYRHEMTDADHRQLIAAAKKIRGFVVLSGYPNPIYQKLLAKWHRVEKTGPLADGALQRTEVLWISPRTWEALEQNQDLFSARFATNFATNGNG
jgi:DNA adenine methylase